MTNINFYQGQTNLLKDIEDTGDKNIQNLQIERIRDRINEFFNVKNIHFLFGSGTSCNAIPDMKGLYNKVKKKIEGLGRTSVKQFTSISERAKPKNDLEDILGILYSKRAYLLNFDQLKASFELNEALIEAIEKIIFENLNVDFSKAQAQVVLDNYKTFYQKLALRNKDLSRLNIFTTNNDLFNESALDSLNIHYMNGFGGGLNKFFNPALFNYTYSKRMDTSFEKYEPVENVVNLYKIHGSVNWIEDDSNINSFFKIREIGYPERLGRDKKTVLIYPTPMKQNKSLGSPYVELFREFQKKLLEPNSVLFVIGYSFSDEHVNNIIYQALATNSTINVVILNDITNKAISKIDNNRIFRMWGTIEKESEKKDEEGTGADSKSDNIHYFHYIVNSLFPNIDANKNEDTTLKKFIESYNKSLSK